MNLSTVSNRCCVLGIQCWRQIFGHGDTTVDWVANNMGKDGVDVTFSFPGFDNFVIKAGFLDEDCWFHVVMLSFSTWFSGIIIEETAEYDVSLHMAIRDWVLRSIIAGNVLEQDIFDITNGRVIKIKS